MGVGLNRETLSPVVVRLTGGLGNQMFQYAAGLHLASRLSCPVVVDTRVYDTYRLHGYELNAWSISAKPAPAEILKQASLLKIRFGEKWPFLLGKERFFKEKSLAFDPAWLQIKTPKWLLGYFQSEQYFAASRAQILKEFSLPQQLSEVTQNYQIQMASAESVAVHVRRGDYVTNTETMRIHGVCSRGYYENACSSIQGRLSNPVFYVFSNDPDWARQNIGWPERTVFVNSHGNSPAVDIALMASCKHHIIANSSFSWWGAWLSANLSGIKIAPSPWFDEPSYLEGDLVPKSWERITK